MKSPTTLRERAEAAVRSSSADVTRMAPEEVQRLVHELQVHQIELEMQNEELREAQADLALSRDRYSDLYDFAPVGYLTLDADAIIREMNLTAARLFDHDRSQLVGQKFTHSVIAESQDTLYHHQRAVRGSDEQQVCELLLRRADGTTFAARMETIRVEDPVTLTPSWRCVISDITARKQAEAMIGRQRQELDQMARERTERLEAANAQLRATNAELDRFNRATVERELRMIELKKEVNELRIQTGQLPRYTLESEEETVARQKPGPTDGTRMTNP